MASYGVTGPQWVNDILVHWCICTSPGLYIFNRTMRFFRLFSKALEIGWPDFGYIRWLIHSNECYKVKYLFNGSKTYIDGLVQDCSNPIANKLDLLQSYSKPSVYEYLAFCLFLDIWVDSRNMANMYIYWFGTTGSCNNIFITGYCIQDGNYKGRT